MMGLRRRSLGQRLMVGIIVVSFTYWAVIAVMTIRDTIDEVYELFDVNMAQSALALMRVVDPDEPDILTVPNRAEAPSMAEIFNQWRVQSGRLVHKLPALPADNKTKQAMHEEYERNLRYQIWDRHGQLLMRSSNAPLERMVEADGYSESRDEIGQLWRHFGIWDIHGDFRILVSEAHDVRNRLIRNIALHLVSPLAMGLPVLIALLLFSINRGLDPLGALTREIQVRKPDNLLPLDTRPVPLEVRPMVLALNDLLRRVSGSLDGERRFTANAAHELRTPLATIQAQLHVARLAVDSEERGQAFGQLQDGVDRAIRLVGQMLVLARLDADQVLPDVQPLCLGHIAEEVCAEVGSLALQRHQTMELNVASGLPVYEGNADMLAMMLRNLVENAIRHTPAGGHIEVGVRVDAISLCLGVSDDGPGIPAELRERVFESFYRIPSPDQTGTGLGLAICLRIAELHGARIALSSGLDGKGVHVGVRFPLVMASEESASRDGRQSAGHVPLALFMDEQDLK